MNTGAEHKKIEVVVSEGEAGERVDRLLGKLPAIPSRSFAEKAIANGLVRVNGSVVKPSYRVVSGDVICVTVTPPKETMVEPEPIPLEVAYEDSDLLVINKPRGLVVHPGAGHQRHTLVNALLHHCSDLSGIGGELRPGIVHRLDKDTTGLLVVAKNDFTHAALSAALKAREIHRWYLALTRGTPKTSEGLIDAPIGRHQVQRQKMAVTQTGRFAITTFRVLASCSGFSLIQLKLKTGRTHQIRVHLNYIGNPVVGDPVYGNGSNLGLTGQALHACRLRFYHPRTGEVVDCFAPPPADFQGAILHSCTEDYDYSKLALDNWGLDC